MLDGSLMLGGRTPLTSKLASNINIDYTATQFVLCSL